MKNRTFPRIRMSCPYQSLKNIGIKYSWRQNFKAKWQYMNNSGIIPDRSAWLTINWNKTCLMSDYSCIVRIYRRFLYNQIKKINWSNSLVLCTTVEMSPFWVRLIKPNQSFSMQVFRFYSNWLILEIFSCEIFINRYTTLYGTKVYEDEWES